HLDGELDPVDPAGVRHAEHARDGGADQRRDAADHHRQPERDALAARDHQPAQRADDDADDEGGEDAGDFHRTRSPRDGPAAVLPAADHAEPLTPSNETHPYVVPSFRPDPASAVVTRAWRG